MSNLKLKIQNVKYQFLNVKHNFKGATPSDAVGLLAESRDVPRLSYLMGFLCDEEFEPDIPPEADDAPEACLQPNDDLGPVGVAAESL